MEKASFVHHSIGKTMGSVPLCLVILWYVYTDYTVLYKLLPRSQAIFNPLELEDDHEP